MRLLPVSLCVLLLAAACAAPHAPVASPSAAARPAAAAVEHGRAFAQQRCAACHAVGGGISPNPEAPTFAAIVNTPGLSHATLQPWLRRSHNFPQMMQFTIAPKEIDSLAAYMLTLQSDDYRPIGQ